PVCAMSACVFDLGDVVCRFVPDARLRALVACSGLDLRQVDAAIWRSGLDARAEAGELTPEETTNAVLEALDHRLDAEQLRAAWARAFVPNDQVTALVRRVTVPTVLFTNNGPLVSACLANEMASTVQLFSRTVCSWELRATKPDPKA